MELRKILVKGGDFDNIRLRNPNDWVYSEDVFDTLSITIAWK